MKTDMDPLFTYTPPMRGQLAMATDTEDEMEAKHTPGPWEVEPTLHPDWDDDPMGEYTDGPMGEYTIEPVATLLSARYYAAEPESDELDAVHAENRANARLIAAAPDLLDALSTMLAVVKWNGLINQESPDAMTLYAAIGQAEDAIAKAEAQS